MASGGHLSRWRDPSAASTGNRSLTPSRSGRRLVPADVRRRLAGVTVAGRGRCVATVGTMWRVYPEAGLASRAFGTIPKRTGAWGRLSGYFGDEVTPHIVQGYLDRGDGERGAGCRGSMTSGSSSISWTSGRVREPSLFQRTLCAGTVGRRWMDVKD